MNLSELEAELTQLDARIKQIKSKGDIYTDCRIDISKPGGTAASGAKPHHRLRFKFPVDGKKSKYLPDKEVGSARAAISPGKQLKKLERQRQSIIRKMDQIHTRIAELQGSNN